MDRYESPTIEQAGGPDNHIEPNVIIPWGITDVLVFLEAVFVASVAFAALATVYTTTNSITND